VIYLDLKAGVVVSAGGQWTEIFKEATKLAEQHSAGIECRSLDVLHCAVAKAGARTLLRVVSSG
jgi:hypothetical protein